MLSEHGHDETAEMTGRPFSLRQEISRIDVDQNHPVSLVHDRVFPAERNLHLLLRFRRWLNRDQINFMIRNHTPNQWIVIHGVIEQWLSQRDEVLGDMDPGVVGDGMREESASKQPFGARQTES